jgi:hypothetical protein
MRQKDECDGVTYMMTIDAVIDIAFLSVGAGVETGKVGDSISLIFIRSIVVHKTALIALGARTT